MKIDFNKRKQKSATQQNYFYFILSNNNLHQRKVAFIINSPKNFQRWNILWRWTIFHVCCLKKERERDREREQEETSPSVTWLQREGSDIFVFTHWPEASSSIKLHREKGKTPYKIHWKCDEDKALIRQWNTNKSSRVGVLIKEGGGARKRNSCFFFPQECLCTQWRWVHGCWFWGWSLATGRRWP